MPPATLTPEQSLAIDCRDVSVSLSAGAGCGKTHVLTSRFLSHLDPTGTTGRATLDLHQLIAITFTDAAAREMRSRIAPRAMTDSTTQSFPVNDRTAWQRSCANRLRPRQHDPRLLHRPPPLARRRSRRRPDVRRPRTRRSRSLLNDALDEVLRRRLSASDPDTLDLAAEFGTLAQLKQRISLLVDQRHRPAFRRWQCKGEVPTYAQQMVDAWHERYKPMPSASPSNPSATKHRSTNLSGYSQSPHRSPPIRSSPPASPRFEKSSRDCKSAGKLTAAI